MTVDDVLEHVRQTKGWVLEDYAKSEALLLRRPCATGMACPISSLWDVDAGDVWDVAECLSLSHEETLRIVSAADDEDSSDPLRARLLQAAGLA